MKDGNLRTACALPVAWVVLAATVAWAQGNEPAGPKREEMKPAASNDAPDFEKTPLNTEEGAPAGAGKPAKTRDETPVFSFFFWTGVIVLAIGGALWLVRRLLPGARSLFPSPAINVIGRRALGGTASLLLVEVGNRILRIGLSKDSFLYMGEISDAEEIAMVKGKAAQGRADSAAREFAQVLKESVKEGEEAPKPPPPTSEEKEDDIRAELEQIRRTLDGWKA